MAPNGSPVFPMEIIAKIAEDIDWSSRDLSALSLTCRGLVRVCQRRLYDMVYVGDYETTEETERKNGALHELLSTSPHIADYICALRYNPTTEWTSESDLLLRISARLHHIQDFLLEGPSSSSNWEDFSTYTQSAVTKIIQAHSLTRLSMANLEDFPLSILSAAYNLTDLLFQDMLQNYPSGSVGVATTVGHPPIHRSSARLRTYSTLQCAGVTSTLIDDSILDFSHLKELKVAWGDYRDVTTTKKLMAVARSIEKFDCQVLSSQVARSMTEDLMTMILSGSHRTLKTLELATDLPSFPTICILLESLGNRNVLEKLTISMSGDSRIPFKFDGQLEHFSALLSSDAFPRLRVVELDSRLPRPPRNPRHSRNPRHPRKDQDHEEYLETVRQECHDQLAGLRRREGLDLKYTVL
ncbi:hypothetical protein BDZ97DRAFT_1810885 [Flammula alnicola]|nr:hypothetical protein BDZ97DRAFT_1810885 [Flammula alnicola]